MTQHLRALRYAAHFTHIPICENRATRRNARSYRPLRDFATKSSLILGLEVSTATIAAMHDYLLACTRPDGELVPLHDTRYPPAKKGPTSDRADRRLAFRLSRLRRRPPQQLSLAPLP